MSKLRLCFLTILLTGCTSNTYNYSLPSPPDLTGGDMVNLAVQAPDLGNAGDLLVTADLDPAPDLLPPADMTQAPADLTLQCLPFQASCGWMMDQVCCAGQCAFPTGHCCIPSNGPCSADSDCCGWTQGATGLCVNNQCP